MNDEDKDDGNNWASPAELAAALKSGEIDPSVFVMPGANRHQRRAFAKKNDVPVPKPTPGITTSRMMTDAWGALAKEVMPLSATPEQHKWAKRFFMAGGMTLLTNLIYSDTLDDSDTETATPQDVNRVDAIYHELNAFFSAIRDLN